MFRRFTVFLTVFGVLAATLALQAGTALAAVPDVPACAFNVDAVGVNVSWVSVDAVDKYVIRRTVNGGNLSHTGAVTGASSHEFVDGFPSAGAGATMTYTVEAKTGNQYGAQTDCVEDGISPIGSCLFTVEEAGVHVSWTAASDADKYVIRRTVNGGNLSHTGAVTGASKHFFVDNLPSAGAGAAMTYTVEAKTGTQYGPGTDCTQTTEAQRFPSLRVPTTDGSPEVPFQISQDDLAASSFETYNNCDSLPANHYVYAWPNGLEENDLGQIVVNADSGIRQSFNLAFPLGRNPITGHNYRVRFDVTVIKTGIGMIPDAKSGYDLTLTDAVPREQQDKVGYLEPTVDVGEGYTFSLYGNTTDQGFYYGGTGYTTLKLRNYYAAWAGSPLQFRVSAHVYDWHNPGATPTDAEINDLPEVEPNEGPCSLQLSPGNPALGPVSATWNPGIGFGVDWSEVDWWEVAKITGEIALDVADVLITFIPGYDCLEAIVRGISVSNSIFCLADIVGAGLAVDIGHAGDLARSADDIIATVSRNGDNVDEAIIDGIRASDNSPNIGAFCSFSGDTEVLMADGSTKPIATVEPGDWVLAGNPLTGERGAREVTHQWSHQDTLVDLVVTNGQLATTEDHPFWNATDLSWQRADELHMGDQLVSADGDLILVHGIDDSSARQTAAYNLSVDDLHTYFVSVADEQVLVHNSATCDPSFTPAGAVEIAPGNFETFGGLIYGPRPNNSGEHAIDHVLGHLVADAGDPAHTVFATAAGDPVSPQALFDLIDEAWASRGAHVGNDAWRFEIPINVIPGWGNTVGTAGETSIRIIGDPNTGIIRTAYPI